MNGGKRKREETKRVRRARARAALAGTGAAFSGLSTFFNARRQLSRSSPSLDDCHLLRPSIPALFFVSSASLARLLHFRRIRLLLPPFRHDRQFSPPRIPLLSAKDDDTSRARFRARWRFRKPWEQEFGCLCRLAAPDKCHWIYEFKW